MRAKKTSQQPFLERLQQEAVQQALISQKKVLPQSLDWLTSLLGTYSWQILVLLAIFTAGAVEFLK